MRLGAEHRPDLVDPLEHADHHLLVELRALREVAGPAEVVDAEHVGAGLGRRRDDLRCLDLDEAGRVERARASRRATARRAGTPRAGGVAQRDRGVVEQVRQLLLELGTRRLTGGGSGVAATRVNFGSTSSTPPGACAFSLGVPSTAKTVSSNHFATSARCRIVVDDDLAHAFAVAEDDEVDPRRGRWFSNQPCNSTRSPTCSLSSVDQTRIGERYRRPLNRCDARTG